MIPGNAISTTPVVAEFIYPYSLPAAYLTQTVPGGLAISDPSQGRLYQTWTITYDRASSSIIVADSQGNIGVTLNVVGVLQCSLAFDSNMSPVICWLTANGGYLRYFNPSSSAYIVIPFPTATSCLVAVDFSAQFYVSLSDVMFTYTDGVNVYYRRQRDLYATDFVVGPTSQKLVRFGPSVLNRLQWELTNVGLQ